MSPVWYDHKTYIELTVPDEFDFSQCLAFLNRSRNECMHHIEDTALYKAIRLEGEVLLLKVTSDNKNIRIDFPCHSPAAVSKAAAACYIWELFDLSADLPAFYRMAGRNEILKDLVNEYRGLRIIGMPDLFEALVWAVTGQQINLTFTYTLKRRLVEAYGENYRFGGREYWLFPEACKILSLDTGHLTAMQFTRRKAEYILGIAKAFVEGSLHKQGLIGKSYCEIHDALMDIRGIGHWTADYVIMKTFKIPFAFPIGDAGLHNAIKNILDRKEKPSLEEIRSLAVPWKGWEAYATFYLWRSLQG
jgi:DNA-3-methyladenine glycosylase II